jgi:hypothetical protein
VDGCYVGRMGCEVVDWIQLVHDSRLKMEAVLSSETSEYSQIITGARTQKANRFATLCKYNQYSPERCRTWVSKSQGHTNEMLCK